MRTVWIVIIAFGLCLFLSWLSMFVIPSLLGVAIGVLAFLGLLASTVIGCVKGRQSLRGGIAPILACIAFIALSWLVASPLGNLIADWQFRRHLDEYAKVVNAVRSGSTVLGERGGMIDAENNPNNIRTIEVIRVNDGTLIVAFEEFPQLPLVHEGNLYYGCSGSRKCGAPGTTLEQALVNNPPAGGKQWPYVRHVVGDWYHFSDQPGL